MKPIQKAQQELNTLKNDVIGIFKMNGRIDINLVVNYQETNQTIDTITITNFGAIQLEYNLPLSFGTLHLFPDNKNMNEMLDNPFEWDKFIKQF
jgi:hypothetical protein